MSEFGSVVCGVLVSGGAIAWDGYVLGIYCFFLYVRILWFLFLACQLLFKSHLLPARRRELFLSAGPADTDMDVNTIDAITLKICKYVLHLLRISVRTPLSKLVN